MRVVLLYQSKITNRSVWVSTDIRLFFSPENGTSNTIWKVLKAFRFSLFQESDRDGEPAVPVGLLGQGPQPGISSVAIVPPTTGDDYDSDGSSGSDDDQRPLTQEELKNKILKGVEYIGFIYP